jgi:quinol monooxygenase YgiN
MYARTTTIQAQPSSIDAGIAHIRDTVTHALEDTDGYVGLSLMVDRESGRCIVTSAWQSAQAMRASVESVTPIRDRAIEAFGGSAQVEEWEIAAFHRDHRSPEGACVRVAWFTGDPDRVDEGIDVYKLTNLPGLEALEGFCSASLLVDRASGRAVTSATYDSVGAIQRNRDQSAALRTAVTQQAGTEMLDICEFELALAHLRVPEMA